MMGKKRFGRVRPNTIKRLNRKKNYPWVSHCSPLRALLHRLNQSLDSGFDSQEPEKLSSDVTTTSISMPDQSPPRLAELGSKASLRACSARMEENPSDDHLKGSEEVSSHVTTTSMPDQAISSSDQVQRCDSFSTSAMLLEKKKEEDE
ncbi:unnamed protein product [Arabidopsis lyrata]|nr:unnamed protein product [Arabidopsis lyrata]